MPKNTPLSKSATWQSAASANGATVRKLRFKPSLRTTMLGNAAYLASMAPGGELPLDLAASMERTLPKAPKHRVRSEDMSAVDIDAVHRTQTAPLESEVTAAISKLLAVHPKVLIAIRMNSGMASYEAASGRYAPVHFHKWLRYPEKMRMPDFIGWLTDGRPFAIEAKRPTWTRPRDDREREQAMYLEAMRDIGGIGIFATSADWVAEALGK